MCEFDQKTWSDRERRKVALGCLINTFRALVAPITRVPEPATLGRMA